MATHIKFIRLECKKPYYRIMNDMNIDPDDDIQSDRDDDDDDDECRSIDGSSVIESKKKKKKLQLQIAAVVALTVESVRIMGEYRTIRRVFVRTNDSFEYSKLGWVINEDIDCCMICARKFSVFDISLIDWMTLCMGGRHHCRACGNIICTKCIARHSFVEDLRTSQPVIVCRQCCWGQEQVELCHSTATVVQTIELPTTKYTSFNRPKPKLIRADSKAVGLMKVGKWQPTKRNQSPDGTVTL